MPLTRFRPRFTVRRLMMLVAVVGLLFGAYDQVRMFRLAARYRRMAEAYAERETRSRKIDAMDPITRAEEAEAAMDDPFLNDPDWNRRMISWFAAMKRKYREAAAHPRRPVAPDPPPL